MILDFDEMSDRAQDWWSHYLGAMSLGRWSEAELRAWLSPTGKPGSKADLCAQELKRRAALEA